LLVSGAIGARQSAAARPQVPRSGVEDGQRPTGAISTEDDPVEAGPKNKHPSRLQV